mmetsp:Transcript_34467/g.97206  ORF Transcript_34467/g.97206 Transcript_34467/m.97206 type:complete len:232 (-) Transcript_34467:689-1384(-)
MVGLPPGVGDWRGDGLDTVCSGKGFLRVLFESVAEVTRFARKQAGRGPMDLQSSWITMSQKVHMRMACRLLASFLQTAQDRASFLTTFQVRKLCPCAYDSRLLDGERERALSSGGLRFLSLACRRARDISRVVVEGVSTFGAASPFFASSPIGVSKAEALRNRGLFLSPSRNLRLRDPTGGFPGASPPSGLSFPDLVEALSFPDLVEALSFPCAEASPSSVWSVLALDRAS